MPWPFDDEEPDAQQPQGLDEFDPTSIGFAAAQGVLRRYGGTQPERTGGITDYLRAGAEGAMAVVGAPKAGLDWVARQSAAAQGIPVADDATMGGMLRDALLPAETKRGGLLDYRWKPEDQGGIGKYVALAAQGVPGLGVGAALPDAGAARSATGGAMDFGYNMALDPLTYVGVPGLSTPRSARVASKILAEQGPGIAQYAPEISKALLQTVESEPVRVLGKEFAVGAVRRPLERAAHLGFQAQMGLGAVQGGLEAKRLYDEAGGRLTPEAAEAATQALLSGAMVAAPTLAKHGRRAYEAAVGKAGTVRPTLSLPIDQLPDALQPFALEEAKRYGRQLADGREDPLSLPENLREFAPQIEEHSRAIAMALGDGRRFLAGLQEKQGPGEPGLSMVGGESPETYTIVQRGPDGNVVGGAKVEGGALSFVAGGRAMDSPVSARPLFEALDKLGVQRNDELLSALGAQARRSGSEATAGARPTMEPAPAYAVDSDPMTPEGGPGEGRANPTQEPGGAQRRPSATWHRTGRGESAVPPGLVRIYNGGGTNWFTPSREVAEEFAHEATFAGKPGLIRYLDVPADQVERFRGAADDTGAAIPAEDAVLVPDDVASRSVPLFRWGRKSSSPDAAAPQARGAAPDGPPPAGDAQRPGERVPAPAAGIPGGFSLPKWEGEIRQNIYGDKLWYRVDSRAGWGTVGFASKADAKAGVNPAPRPGEPVKMFRGTTPNPTPDNSEGATRYGPARYFADSRNVARTFAEYRGGDVIEQEIPYGKRFDADYPDVTTPEFGRLLALLEQRGVPRERALRAVEFQHSGDSFKQLADLLPNANRKALWRGADELNGLLREAGYEQVGGRTQDSPDFPNHREVGLLDKGPQPGDVSYSTERAPAQPFYSQLRRVVDDPKTQGTQTGEQWLRFLSDPKRQVKADELKWTGLGDFLAAKAGERVTRQQVTEYLDQNAVQVQEVTKGTPAKLDWRQDGDGMWWGRDPAAKEPRYQVYARKAPTQKGETIYELADLAQSGRSRAFPTPGAAQEFAGQLLRDERGAGPKFAQYTLPGAENYREVLLTLPKKSVSLLEQANAIRDEKLRQPDTPEGHARVAALNERLGAIWAREQATRAGEGDDFAGGHWDEPNVLAHLRLSDRVDAEGKKTLLVEEIQSDWAQKGRKEGFASPSDKLVAKRDADASGNAFWRVETDSGRFVANVTDPGLSPEAAVAEVQRRVQAGDPSRMRKGVPAGPFLDSTSKWTDLASKRLLKMAADGGYDRIAIVPGEEQAKRYDLSTQVDAVFAEKLDDGTYRLKAEVPSRGMQDLGESVPPEKLPDIVGKDLAEKIVSSGGGKFSGVDLKVGGEGMKGYYDRIVPESLNRLAKKYGVKVQAEGGAIDTGETTKNIDQSRLLAEATRQLEEGDTGASWVLKQVARGRTVTDATAALESARQSDPAYLRRMGVTPESFRIAEEFLAGESASRGIPVHTLDVPPAMREQISREGMPLFATEQERRARALGFPREGRTGKPYAEQRYSHTQPVRVRWADGSEHVDEVKGLNAGHALARARENWPDAQSVEPISREEMDRSPLLATAQQPQPGESITTPQDMRKLLVDLYPDNSHIREAQDGTYAVTLPNKQVVTWRPGLDHIEINVPAFESAYGRKPLPGESAVGATYRLPNSAIVDLVQGVADRKAIHEHWHVVKHLGNLSAKQEARLARVYPTEEKQADAFGDWFARERRQPNGIFEKIERGVRRVYDFVTQAPTQTFREGMRDLGAPEVRKPGATVEPGPVSFVRDSRANADVAAPAPAYSIHNMDEWEANARAFLRKKGVATELADRYVSGMREQIGIIRSLAEREGALDLFPKGAKVSVQGIIRGNSDPLYKITIDATSECVRRLNQRATGVALMKALGRELSSDEAMAVVLGMRAEGKTATCLYCYVENPRRGQLDIITKLKQGLAGGVVNDNIRPAVRAFIKAGIKPEDLRADRWLDPTNYKGEMKDVTVKVGGAAVRFSDWVTEQVNGAKAKALDRYEEYSGEVLSKISDDKAEYLRNAAGLRFFLNSDFQIEHVADLMQAVSDAAVRDLPGHAYTKIPAFAEIFGKSGLKINTSLRARTLPDGRVVPDEVDGMPWAEAKRLRATSPDVGAVLVAMDDAQIQYGLNSPDIDFIIPYHHSALPAEYRGGGTVANPKAGEGPLPWKDYTGVQHESWLPGAKPWIGQDGKLIEAKLPKALQKYVLKGEPFIRTGQLLEGARETGVPDAVLGKRYLDIASALGVQPVFPQFVDHPNYAKLKKDFARTDTPFQSLRPEFDMERTKALTSDFIRTGGRSAEVDQAVFDKMIGVLQANDRQPGLAVRMLQQDELREMSNAELVAAQGAARGIALGSKRQIPVGAEPAYSTAGPAYATQRAGQRGPYVPVEPYVRDETHGSEKWLAARQAAAERVRAVDPQRPVTPQFKAWFGDWQAAPERASKVVDEQGQPLPVYRGDNRADRVGTKLKVSRTTSGRFFFTDDPEVAGGYALSKPDSSAQEALANTEDWFRFPPDKGARTPNNLRTQWYRLSPEQQARVKDVLLKAGDSEDRGGFDFSGKEPLTSPDHWAYVVKEAHGNWLKAADEVWLQSGALFNQEHRFGEILKEAGLEAEFDSPSTERPGVFPVYLNIRNPLDTSAIPPSVVTALERVAKADRTRAKAHGVDAWDKTTTTAREWFGYFQNDLKQGTTLAWTRIPEKVTQALQQMGYDGIKDTGGKLGGKESNVWIAFEPQQVKSAIANRGTYDPTSADIRYSTDVEPTDRRLDTRADPFAKPVAVEGPVRPGEERLQAWSSPTEIGRPKEPGLAPRVETKVGELDALRNEQRKVGLNLPDPILSRDTVRSWKSLDPEIRDILADWATRGPQILRRISQGRTPSDVEMMALDAARAGTIEAKDAALADYSRAKGTPDEQAAHRRYLAASVESSIYMLGDVEAGTAAGRALASRARVMEAARSGDMKLFRQLIREGTGLSPRDAQNIVQMWETGDTHLAEALRSAWLGKQTWNKFFQGFRANLLGIPSEVANAASNALMVGVAAGDKRVAVGLDALLSRKSGVRTRHLSSVEAGEHAMLSATWPAIKDFLHERFVGMYKRAWTGESGAIDPNRPIEHQLSPFKTKAGRILWQTPLEAMELGDTKLAQPQVMARELAERANEQARRRLGSNATRSAIAAETDRVLAEVLPSSKSYAPEKHPELIQAARDATNRYLFRDKPGTLLQPALDMRRKLPALNLVFPFMQTPAKVTGMAIAHTPLGFATPELWKTRKAFHETVKAFDAGRATEAQVREAQAKYADLVAPRIMGTLITFGLLAAAKTGVMTGAGPTDSREKQALLATGWQPYSIVFTAKDGHKVYVPYNRFEPIAQVAGIAADVMAMKDAKDANDAITQIVGTVASNIVDRTYMRGLMDFSNAMSNPQQYFGTYVAGMARAVVPRNVVNLTTGLDPTIRDVRPSTKGFLGFPERIAKGVMAEIPGVASLLPERRTATGEVSVRPGNLLTKLLSPIQVSGQKPGTELEAIMAQIGAVPGESRNVLRVNGQPIQLGPRDMDVLSSADRAAASELRRLIASPRFRSLPDTIEEGGNESKQGIIRAVYRKHRAAAREALLDRGDFRRRAREQMARI